MGQGSSTDNLDLYSPLTLADDLRKESPPEKRVVMYHLFQQRFLHLATKHSLVRAAASGRPRNVARLATVVPQATSSTTATKSSGTGATGIGRTWDKHIATIQTFQKSLPAVKWNYELRGSTPFDLPFICKLNLHPAQRHNLT
ncbi:hypothetical protein Pelo_17337 [Pelomyxa schiedti]|nr:hypothetical protein Pelo_17337 [Pelomyxa schiedti]